MKKAFKFRIYPNKNQEVNLNRTLETCRKLYNEKLAERKRQAELNRLKKEFDVFPWGKPEWINKYDQMLDLTATKTSYQKEVFSQVLQDVVKRVDKSFKIILHREIEGKIKTCTIRKDIDQWYVSFSCEIEKPIIPVEIKTRTGIDAGLISLITLSNGEQIEPPEFLRKSEYKLTHEQKRLSRKKKGSGKRNKQRIIVSKVHRKIRNQRKDFAHKTSRMLVDNYDLIKFDDLQIINMVRNHHLAKSISDAGWYQLMNLTEYKAAYAGKFVEFVNPAGTSQTCICGYPVPKDLSVRIHRCPSCGLVMGRDQVSAILIDRSISTVGTTGINARQGLLNRGSMQRDAQSPLGFG